MNAETNGAAQDRGSTTTIAMEAEKHQSEKRYDTTRCSLLGAVLSCCFGWERAKWWDADGPLVGGAHFLAVLMEQGCYV
jgi:hypothetical protein